ncbi:MAG TPA: cell division protein FtsL [Burkholderiaceae bacterium]|nr:cell division protein FtsL [Burkholderiaceae bacterium]
MIRLNIALFTTTLITMLYIVGVQYESRRLFVEVEKANLNVRKLEFENAALQVEKRAQATPLRIEKLAKERLSMRSALPSVTQYIQNESNDDAGANK